MVTSRIQISSEIVLEAVWIRAEGQFASKTDFRSKTPANWAQKSNEILSKIGFEAFRKAISKQIRFQGRFGIDFWSILKPSEAHF